MQSTACVSLTSTLLKKGNQTCFGHAIKQPAYLQITRDYHDPCEPRYLSWQWRPKYSPDIQRCSKLCLKGKACQKRKFFPRFKRSYIHMDIQSCQTKPRDLPPKPQSWSSYLSFLLPEEVTQKPPMGTCRKMLEHRRRKCISPENYAKCVRGECWPLPTEWYGQGVLHVSELALSRKALDTKFLEPIKPCLPSSNLIPKCTIKKMPTCPSTLKCLEDVVPKMPYSQFKGADSDGSPPSLSVRCPIKYVSEFLPSRTQNKSIKLSCRTYGEYKSVECPPQMFNRFMNVDLTSKSLIPIPATTPGYTPQREVKKGVCGRQTFLKPPSIRNFSTGRSFSTRSFPEYIKLTNNMHLQPSRSPVCFGKLMDRAGMNSELLNNSLPESGMMYSFTEKDLEKHEEAARLDEESPVEKKRRIDAKKTKLELLVEKQQAKQESQLGKGEHSKATSISAETASHPILGRMIELEDVPYQRSGFHSSAIQQARKNKSMGSSKSSSGKPTKKDDDRICSGCPGIRGQDNQCHKSKCSTLKGGVRGRCRVDRPLQPGDPVSPLAFKCKAFQDSPCMRPRLAVPIARRFLHWTSNSSKPMKERILVSNNRVLSWRSEKCFGQQKKDPLDVCCDQIDELKKQIASLKGDTHQSPLDQCCSQLDKLKTELGTLKKNKKTSKKRNDCVKKVETSQKAKVCEEPQKKEMSCQKEIEKKKKAEDCAKYLMKNNEQLKKELDKLKKKKDEGMCAEVAKERMKIEERIKVLMQENEKLKAKLKTRSKKSSKDDPCLKSKKTSKAKSKDPCLGKQQSAGRETSQDDADMKDAMKKVDC